MNKISFIFLFFMVLMSFATLTESAEVSVQDINIPFWDKSFTFKGQKGYQKVPASSGLYTIPNDSYSDIELIVYNETDDNIIRYKSVCYRDDKTPLVLNDNIKGEDALKIIITYEKKERRVTCTIKIDKANSRERLESAQKNEYEKILKDFNPTYDKEHILQNLSVHLMWLNKKLSREPYIFPHPYERQGARINIFDRIKKWAEYYPRVYIWYDSNTVSPEAVKNTEKDIKDFGEISNKILLKDINDLKKVTENPIIFSNPSIYFRSDLIRMLLSLEFLKELKKGTFVLYSDLSIDPKKPEELLDPETIFNLNTYGIVLAAKGNNSYENSFHILGNHKGNLLKAIQVGLIDLNFRRALNESELYLYSEYFNQAKYHKQNPYDQVVYDTYSSMLYLYYGLENKVDGKKICAQLARLDEGSLRYCLWKKWGAKVSLYDYPSYTDRVLELQSSVKHMPLYFPVKKGDFSVSHFSR